MTSPPADDYELDEFTKAVMRRARERYQTNVMTHAEAELVVNMLVTSGKLSASRMGMVGFVREVAALAVFIHEEVFDDSGNVKLDFPRTGDQIDLRRQEFEDSWNFEKPPVAQDASSVPHAGKHAGIKEFTDVPLTSCRGFVPMAGFGETRCKSCGRPKDQHQVRVQP